MNEEEWLEFEEVINDRLADIEIFMKSIESHFQVHKSMKVNGN